jgi:hypothetical protein
LIDQPKSGNLVEGERDRLAQRRALRVFEHLGKHQLVAVGPQLDAGKGDLHVLTDVVDRLALGGGTFLFLVVKIADRPKSLASRHVVGPRREVEQESCMSLICCFVC